MISKYIGISPETAALIEGYRIRPDESEDDIIKRTLSPSAAASAPAAATAVAPSQHQAAKVGCDLGKGALLADGEKLFLFRWKQSRERMQPDAVAVAKGGDLYLYDERVAPSKGSYLHPALRLFQVRNNDKNEKGEYISLDAWLYWFVNRSGEFIRASDLRDPTQITRRGRTFISLEELGL
jgi:hypothetical protein